MQNTDRKAAWGQLVDLIETYLEDNQNPDTPVINYKAGKELQKELNLTLSESGDTFSSLMSDIQNYLKYSARTTHPQFNNQLYGGFHFEAMMGELISFIANTSMSTYEISPVATIMEKELIKELNNNIGFADGDGIMCTGGSNANMLAIHCARAKMFPETKRSGNPNKELCIFVSKDAHYSFKKGVSLLGIGLDNLIGVETCDEGMMIPEDLESKINLALESGKTPMMIASTAGTTVMGAFDPVEKNQEIAKKYNLWHHIDGAWGGALMFSDKYKAMLKGSSDADSFTFDAHKLMATGLITSFFLVKDGETLKEANSGGGATYLFHEYENSEFDTGAYSLQCGRKVDSLKLWLVWKSLGHNGLKDLVHGQMEKRNYLVNLIKENERFKLLHDPQYLNVCFQVIPEDEEVDINRYNFDLRYKVMKTGKVMTNFSSWDDGTIFFRHVFANNQTTTEDLDRLISEIIEHA